MPARAARYVITILGALGAAVLPATTALAATPTTLFVDNGNSGCSNSGPGSSATPFCTISAGAAKAVGGQTVQVAAGTYREAVTAPRSGTASAPIVFTAAPGATVTVTGGVQGFTVTKTSGVGILLSSSSHLTIDHNDVSVAGQQVSGLTAKGISLSGTTASAITGNTTHNNSDAGIGVTSASTG